MDTITITIDADEAKVLADALGLNADVLQREANSTAQGKKRAGRTKRQWQTLADANRALLNKIEVAA